MLKFLTEGAPCPCCAYGISSSALQFSKSHRVRIMATDDKAREAIKQPIPAGNLCVQGAKIVDPRDGKVIDNATVLIKKGQIVCLEQGGSVGADPHVERIDATGKFVVPGYNDMHSHVLELADPSGALALMLAEGVTGFRQMSGSPQRLAERRNQTLPIGLVAPAVLEMPGTILTPLNAASSDAVAAEIRLQKKEGADFIKVGFVSPPVFMAALEEARRIGIPILGHLQDGADPAGASTSGFRSIEHLGPGAILWIACSTAEARLQEEAKPVAIKVPPIKIPFLKRFIMWRLQTVLVNPAAFVPPAYVARLQRALDTFSEEKYEALAARFVENDTWHVPTLVRLRTQELADSSEYATDPSLQFMPQKNIRKWRQVTKKFSRLPLAMRETYAHAYPQQLELTRRLADSGVRMMTGTDGGWLSAPGLTLKEEFAELRKVGLSSLKVLQMTTINAAEYLGRTASMGTVQPGRNADLVILNSDPRDSVTNLHDIAGVVRGGHYHSARALEALRSRVAVGHGYLC
jgi:imidazolonepropionase-like amidohydrolase